MAQTEIYLPDTTYYRLIDALESAGPTLCRRTQVIELIGEIGNIWPENCHPDAVDKMAMTPSQKKTAERYRNILETTEKHMVELSVSKRK